MSVVLFYVAISYALIHYLSFVAIPILAFIVMKRIFVYRWLYLVLILVYVFRLMPQSCDFIDEGRIIELNHKSVLVENGLSRVLVYVDEVSTLALGDVLRLSLPKSIENSVSRFGFDVEKWARIRRICGTSSLIEVIQPSQGLMAWLSRGGFNHKQAFVERFRSLIFQSNPLGQHTLWVSLGLIYVVFMSYLKIAYTWIKNPYLQSLYLVMVFTWIGYHFGFPLAWLRVLCFELSRQRIEDYSKRFSFNVIVLLLIVPEGLSQLAFSIPLWIQAIGLFDISHHRFLSRWLLLQVLLQQAFYETQLVFIFFYPVFRRLNQALIHLSLVVLLFPFLTEVFVFAYDHVAQLETMIRSYLVMTGRLNLLAWTVLVMWVLSYAHLNRWIHSALAMVMMFFLIPLAQLPWVYQLSMIHVNQGDAFLIHAPLSRVTVLIDTGPQSSYGRLDTFLKAQGICNLDYLVITHDDHDHSGSLDKLQQAYRIGQVVTTSQDIIHPWLKLMTLDRELTHQSNDDSLVYWTQIHALRALFLGDISSIQERQLSHLYPNLRADVVKIAHHGSNTSSSNALFSWIQARVALIGVGHNRYGHPHPEVLKRLSQHHLRTYQSLVHGDVTIYILPWFNILVSSRYEFLVF